MVLFLLLIFRFQKRTMVKQQMCDPLSIPLIPLWVNMAGDSGFLKELRVQLKSLFPIENIPK